MTVSGSFFYITLQFICLILPLCAANLFAQAPTISYASPQTYTAGSVITTLSPTSSGVAAAGYSGVKTTLGSGFSSPYGVAVDTAGNVYVADNGNHMVKKIPVAGGTPVILGSGFNGPYALAVDAAGNVYAADGVNGVKMIPVDGGSQVSIGSGFSSSYGVAVDAAGNVYVADNGAILKIPAGGGTQITLGTVSGAYGLAVDAAGNIYVANGGSTIAEIPAAGGGAPISKGSGFSIPYSVAVDAAGNVYVADYGNNVIKKIPVSGGSTVTVSSGLSTPYGIALDGSGNLYVSVTGLNIVKKIKPIGDYYIKPFLPAGISFNNSSGTISGTPIAGSPATNYYITAYNNVASNTAALNISVNPRSSAPVTVNYVGPQTYSAGTVISALAPSGGGVAAPAYNSHMVSLGTGFSSPYGLAADAAGNVYVADYSNGAVKKIPAGGGPPVILGSFAQPTGVAVDIAGNVYVSVTGTGIVKIPVGGGSPVTIGSGITDPKSVAVDASGNVYLSDLGDHTVKEIPVSGGSPIILGTSGGFLSPYGVAVDGAGNIYVADLEDNAIKKIPVNGGSPVIWGAGFSVPFSVAVDASGNVYVADSGNKLIKKIPVGGGSPIVIGSGFLNPYGIALDGAGNVYVSDQVNNTIKEIKPAGGYYATPLLPAGLSFDNATGIISGTPNAASQATNYTVTGYNAGGSGSGVVNIKVVPSTSASLAKLKISPGILSPAFAAGTLSYATSVANNTAAITLTPTAADITSTITVNGVAVASGTASNPITLNIGPNTITTVVTALNGKPQALYTLVVTRVASTVATLASLHLSNGTLAPAFSTGTTSYTASVANSITSLTVTPKTTAATATVTVNGAAVTSGTASAAIALNVGANIITTLVTAQDGITTKSYTITVTRAPSSNDILSAITLKPTSALTLGTGPDYKDYTASVTNATSTLQVIATTAATTSTMTVNGTTVASGTTSAAIPLNVGPNIITIVVTAQDGISTHSYVITVTRAPSNNDNLSSLKLNPFFTLIVAAGPDFRDYTTSVTNATSSVQVIPTTTVTTSTVTVNGIAVASGTASGSIALNVGANIITTVVTAQDGVSAHTYSITLTRAASIANLFGVISVSNPTDHPQMMGKEIMVHQGLSPNGDGINDFLMIDGIANYPDNKLQIINRSGQLIFEAKGYNNSTKVFDGHSNANGAMLLPGTYFYSLDYAVNGVTKHKTGFIVLKY